MSILRRLISSRLYNETLPRPILKFGSVPIRGKGLNYNPKLANSYLIDISAFARSFDERIQKFTVPTKFTAFD